MGKFLRVALALFVAVSSAYAVESLVVTTTVDEDNGTSDPSVGAGTSLREAIKYANSDGVNSTITFDATAFAAPRKTITLNGTPFPALIGNGTITIMAPAAGVEISGNNASRIFQVNTGANATLTGLTIRNGNANPTGGAILNLGRLLLDSCTLTANNATLGGAIYSDTDLNTPLSLTNCTLSGNAATQSGGAIYNNDGLTVLESCTITSNTAPAGQGSGVTSFGNSTFTRTEVHNSIISANTNTDVDFVDGNVTNSFQSDGYNLIGDGNGVAVFNQATDSTGNTDPGLFALADNGGPTQTRALMTNSPARDTGNTTLTVDQRGRFRPQGSSYDKGAFELEADPTIVTTVNDTVTDDGKTSLREAIMFVNANGNLSFQTVITFNLPESQKVGGIWTINLTGALPSINNKITMTGPGAKQLVVRRDTGGDYRIFTIPNTGRDTVISGMTIRDGLIDPPSNGGGAIFCISALTLIDCLIANNQATPSGGGIELQFNNGTFTGCTFSNNTSFQGGAIDYQSGTGYTLTVTNCTFDGNSATTTTSRGGAITHIGSNLTSTLQVTNCTIVNNSAPIGSGIATSGVFNQSNAQTFLSNTIFANNNGPNLTSENNQGGIATVTSQGYNLCSDNGNGLLTATGDQINTDPLLVPLQDNGGQTPTHALMANSPALNTGNTNLTTDQRGVPRPQGGADDKGAFERSAPPGFNYIVTTTADVDNSNYAANDLSLREAINLANSDVANSTISFDPTVFAAPRKTITLSGTALPDLRPDGTLSINAPTAGVEISGNNASRVFQNFANTTMKQLTIRNGQAAGDVGGGLANYAPLLLDSCTLSANSSAYGGAIFSDTDLFGTALIVQNCTLSGNSATLKGGGILNFDGATIIDSSTIVNNTAPTGEGSGIASTGNSSTHTQTHNSIIAGNTNSSLDFVDGGTNSFFSTGYNLTGAGNAIAVFNQTGDTNIGFQPPRLGPLKNNGGPTNTCQVLLTSFARDTGSSNLSTDQRGLARVFDSVADRGVYELQYETYSWWAGYTFPSGTPANLSAANGDYDGDGIENGIERLTGSDPLTPNAFANVLLFEIQGTDLVLQFNRSLTTDPASILVEQSLDLQMWTTNGVTLRDLGLISGFAEMYQAVIPINGATKKFGRLRFNP